MNVLGNEVHDDYIHLGYYCTNYEDNYKKSKMVISYFLFG